MIKRIYINLSKAHISLDTRDKWWLVLTLTLYTVYDGLLQSKIKN